MDFIDKIRGLLGLPYRSDGIWNRTGFRNPIIGEENDDDDDDDILEDDYSFSHRQNPFRFNIFSGDIVELQKLLQEELNEMMKSFQSNWAFPPIHGPDSLSPIEEPQNFDDNPRNKFLKPEYIEPPQADKSHEFGSLGRNWFSSPAYILPPRDPLAKKDTDVDDKVDPSQILDLFSDKSDNKQRMEPYSNGTESRFSSKVVTKRKKMLPNGGVEEEESEIVNGRERRRTVRTLGEMKHIITINTLPDATTEVTQQFINFDEDKLADFNKAWGSPTSTALNNYQQNNSGQVVIPDLFRLYDIFKNFIP